MLRPRNRRLVAVAAAIAMLAVACGGDDTDADAPDDTSEESTDSDSDADTGDEGSGDGGDVAAGDLDPDATLRGVMAAGVTIETLDPDEASGGNGLRLSMPVYDRLIHTNVGTSQLEPGLAESWDLVEDGTILELKLREGVVFHDGESFNADAVIANFERSRDSDQGRDESTVAVSPISEFEAVDEFTVRLHRADDANQLDWSLLPSRLTENAGMMISPAALGNDDLDRNPVGAGAWQLREITGDTVVYDAFEDYWDPEKPKAAELRLTSITDDEATFSSVLSGDQDLAVIQAPQQNRAETEAEAGRIELLTANTLINWHLWLHHDLAPLDDIRVREAMSLAIDREQTLEAVQFGLGQATPQHFPPRHFAFNEDHGLDEYPHDPERASELLEEAGYDGTPLVLEVPTSPELRVRLAEALAAQMEDVGFVIELDIVERSDRAFAFQEPPTHGFLGQRTRIDPLLHLADSYSADASFNPAGEAPDERTQELLDECATLAAGSSEWESCLQELSGHSTAQFSVLSYFTRDETWVANPCLTGWTPPSGQHEDWTTVGLRSDC